MLHEYSNLYFPICSVVVSILLVFIYFSKENIKNTDTRFYLRILFLSMAEAILNFLILLLVHIFFNDSTYIWFVIPNKILYIIYILWISNLFIYFVNVSYEENKKLINIVQRITMILDIVFCFLIIISKIDLVYDVQNKLANSAGIASYILYVVCAFYILLMIFFVVPRYNKSDNKKKFLPLWILIIIMIATLWVRAIDPYINITSNVVSLISLIMFFTIENPDLKMLNSLKLAEAREKKANQVKNEFLSSMSHELRTPLNVLYGNCQLLPTVETLEEAKELAEETTISIETLLNMINEIVDVSKIQANEINTKEENYNINREIENIITLFDNKIESKGLILDKNLANIPDLFGNITILKKIIINVIDNSVKYTEKGSITITTKYSNELLKIIIKDTGVGINRETLKRLCTLFERGEYRDSNINGLGLGLYISKYLIELLHGEIKIDSTKEVGTTVIITLKQKESEK